eukprot:156622-Prorocentrum_lima.AAC.1
MSRVRKWQTAVVKQCLSGLQASTVKCRTSKDLKACRKQPQGRTYHIKENTSMQDGVCQEVPDAAADQGT